VLANLAKSGITAEDAADENITCNSVFGDPLFTLPYYDEHDRPMLCGNGSDKPFNRTRSLAPTSNGKYRQPPGSVNHIYLSRKYRREWARYFADTDVALVIVEGEKKAICACRSGGVVAIGLGGVYSWRQDGKPIADMRRIVWKGRTVYTAFDSDKARNWQVRDGEDKLCGYLKSQGALVRVVDLRDDGENKVGLDDYLMQSADLKEAMLGLLENAYEPLDVAINWTLPAAISASEWEAARIAPDCIVENYLYADVAELVAPGGVGKTTLMLFEAIHIVLGLPLWGLLVQKPGPVLIATAEDSREICVGRMRRIAEALDLTSDQIAKVMQEVRIADVSGTGFRLTQVVGDVVLPAPIIDQLVREARPLKPVLVVIDPAISFGVGETRTNDAEHGLVEAARRIRNALECCVRFVHHVGKVNAREKNTDQYASRGGSALPDGCRMVAVMQPLDAEEWIRLRGGEPLSEGASGVRVARPKLSYVPAQPDLLIERVGFGFQAFQVMPQTREQRLEQDATEIEARLAEQVSAGKYPTQNTLEELFKGRLTRTAVRAAVESLLTSGRVEDAVIPNAPPGGHGKHKFLKPRGLVGTQPDSKHRTKF
jgi:RecA-family ATPase